MLRIQTCRQDRTKYTIANVQLYNHYILYKKILFFRNALRQNLNQNTPQLIKLHHYFKNFPIEHIMAPNHLNMHAAITLFQYKNNYFLFKIIL